MQLGTGYVYCPECKAIQVIVNKPGPNFSRLLSATLSGVAGAMREARH
jgi:hypothetical protein